MISVLVLPSAVRAVGVGAGALAVAQAADGDHVQRAVGVAVTAVVEAVAVGAAGGDGDRAGAAERGERRFAAEPLDVLAGGDQQRAGVTGGDGDARGRGRRCLGDERFELAIERGDLGVEIDHAARERSQRGLRRVDRARAAASGRREGARRASRGRVCVLRAAAARRSSSGAVTIRPLQRVERGAARLDRAVAHDPQLTDRLDDPGRVLGDHDPAGGQHVACGHLGVDRVALAAPPAAVRVRLVDLEHLKALGAQVAHQPGRVAAGRFHAQRSDRRRSAATHLSSSR